MKALVRRPSSRLHEGCVSFIERSAVDLERAIAQWHRYVQALADHGWEIVEIPPDDASPDGVFVEDTAVVVGRRALICRPGAPSRAAEPATVEPVLTRLGYAVDHISAPATLEGGDVLEVGSTCYVGVGARTNRAGVAQLTVAVEPLGIEVVAVPVSRALHLKSTVTALPDGTVVGWAPVVDEPERFERYVAMPEEAGAHVVDLGGGHVLMSAAAPESAAIVASLGYDPVLIDIGEYEKLEGCVTCLSIRLPG